MSHFPPNEIYERRRKFVRRLGMALSGLMVMLVLIIFGLILRSESAHDEASCPFANLSERTHGDAHVIEESRECIDGVEERRWLVARAGQETYELARKRLEKSRFAESRFLWKIEQNEQEKLSIHLVVDGQTLSEFHEEDIGR